MTPIPDEALDDRLGFLGMTGSGKTWGAGTCVERILARHGRVVIPDALGVWWGLRLSADGKTSSKFDLAIFGGPHADIPITPNAGALIGETAAAMRESAIIDLSQFETAAAERRFMLAFLTAFYRKTTVAPVHLIFDEADLWCLDEKTELLTAHGWRRHEHVRVGDAVVCFNKETDIYQYGCVQRIIIRPYDGPMVRLKTKSLDCLATPDHRVVLRRVQRAKGRYGIIYPWTFCGAGEVPSCVAIPYGGAPIGHGVPDLTTELARVLGWVITDGCRGNRGRALCIDQATTTVKRGVMLAEEMAIILLKYPGVSRYHRNRGGNYSPSFSFYLGTRFSRTLLGWLGEQIHRIPRLILENGNHEQLTALYHGLLEGDGSAQDGGKIWTHFYAGGNEPLADDFQELALRLGISTTKSLARGRNEWCVSIAMQRKMHWVRRRQVEHYKGIVWDITVPTGAFVARRNGRIFVTGNCPERIVDREGNATQLHGMMQNVVRRGRVKGLTSWLISQRPAALSKSVLSQVDGLAAFKLTAAQDRKALGSWIEGQADRDEGKAILGRLPSKQLGEAVVWLPARGILADVKFPAKRTYDSSRAPRHGEKRAQVALPPLDLSALRTRLAAVEEEAKANDPATLRLELATLRKDLAAAQAALQQSRAAKPDHAAIEAAEKRGYERAEASRNKAAALLAQEQTVAVLEPIITGFKAAFVAVAEAQGAAELAVRAAKANARTVAAEPWTPSQAPAPARSQTLPPARKPPTLGAPTVASDGTLSGSDLRMLGAIAFWNALGIATPTRTQVSVVCEWRPTSGHPGNIAGSLRSRGLIEYPTDGTMALTSEGKSAAPEPPAATVVDSVRAVLDGSQRRAFDMLLQQPNHEASREDLAIACGWSIRSGHPGNVFGSMRSLEIVTYPTDGRVALADWIS